MNDISLGRFLSKVRRFIRIRGLINVLVTSSSEMKRLNTKFRDKQEPTDVLSFPANGMNGLAGEIAISLEIAKANAARLGHSTATEIKVLIVHGMLHLAGYNHENDRGEMYREEQRLREKLKLPAGLIQRNNPVKVEPKPSKARTRRAAGSRP